mmetsp:Transcript_15972/g.34725  ORF Transcript_15972/g.34725 Transcript_15972/m.34725 type:complete len:502 (-) Transcript_15972:157-1662(-)
MAPSRCVFVGGLTPNCVKSPDLLESAFARYGQVEQISIKKKNAMPYAFVTFSSIDSASRVVEELSETDGEMEKYRHLFRVLEPAHLSERPRRKQDVEKEKAEVARLVDLARRCNVIVQVPTTHVGRITDYVQKSSDAIGTSTSESGTTYEVRVLGSSNRKDESLLFVHCSCPTVAQELLRSLANTAYISRIIKKTYVLGDGKRIVCSSDATLCTIDSVASEALELVAKSETITRNGADPTAIRIRISSFPPNVAQKLISSIEEVDVDNTISLSPTKASHTLSVIELASGGAYILDLSQDIGTDDYSWGTASTTKSDRICRAQHKIAEVFHRYRGGMLINELQGCVAIDCGSSPGGWSLFLAEQVKCRRIHSVDPAELAQEVIDREAVSHLQMTIEKAIDTLSQSLVDENDKIGLFVSDMCLHDMPEQVDRLLEAREKGLLCKGAYFILTLKNVRSKAKATIDQRAAEQAKRLEPIAEEIDMLFLISNKPSERTIVGRVCRQ